jgi:hypothetical protein
MNSEWDPKYAAFGVFVIATAVFVLEILPRLIRARFEKVTRPEEALPAAPAFKE